MRTHCDKYASGFLSVTTFQHNNQTGKAPRNKSLLEHTVAPEPDAFSIQYTLVSFVAMLTPHLSFSSDCYKTNYDILVGILGLVGHCLEKEGCAVARHGGSLGSVHASGSIGVHVIADIL